MKILRFGDGEKQTQFKANLFRIEYCVMRIAERNLKKQSQFSKGNLSLSIYMKGNYGNIHALKARKNKANSNPNKPNII